MITAAWDVILRQFSEESIRLFGIERWKWVHVLKPYFEKHTVLSAALVAGFVGATAYYCITFPEFASTVSLPIYLLWVIFVSGTIGIPMRYSGMFPHLKQHYYDQLGFVYSFATDAFSGLVVCLTMFILSSILKNGYGR